MLPSFVLVYSLYIATIATLVNKKKQKKIKKIHELNPEKKANNCSGLLDLVRAADKKNPGTRPRIFLPPEQFAILAPDKLPEETRHH
jgi:hypothetical protein